MTLSTKEQEQLDTIFKDPVVVKIIFCTQLYLLLEDYNLSYAIKNAQVRVSERCQGKVSANILAQLPNVVEQIVNCLASQQELFLNQLKIEAFKKYRHLLQSKKSNNLPDILNSFLLPLQEKYSVYHNHAARFHENTDYIFVNKLRPVVENFLKNYLTLEKDKAIYQTLCIFWMAFCAYLALVDLLLYEQPSSIFQIRNVFMCVFGLTWYVYFTKKYALIGVNLLISSLQHKGTPTFDLHKIEFRDLQDTHKEIKTVFLPINPEQAITHLEEQIVPEVSKVRPPKKNPQNIAQVPRSLNFAQILLWPNKTLLRDTNEEWIGSDSEDVRNMQGLNYPKTRYYSFFNKKALSKQIVINPESLPYKNHYIQWRDGVIVPPKGHSGNKKLTVTHGATITEPILEKGKTQFMFFQWELKTLNTLARLLGSECTTVMSKNGERHTLIDYCYHVPEGLGH